MRKRSQVRAAAVSADCLAARTAHCKITSKEDLKSKAIGALRRLQKRLGLVRAFFADPHLRYITA
jgi:hypothetical protein